MIEVSDRADRIDQAIPILDEMVKEGLVTIEDIHILAYWADQKG